MNAAGHPTRHRREYRESADECCLPGPSSLELAEFLGVAPLPRHHPWCSALFPTLYTGTKELCESTG